METPAKTYGTGKAGPGRPKGSKNKAPAKLADMILQALDRAGGVEYLYLQSITNPAQFLTLLGKVLPLQIKADHTGKVEVNHTTAREHLLAQLSGLAEREKQDNEPRSLN